MESSDFAEKQLRKFGWVKGKGLGKNEDGIASAIKPSLKSNKSGLGFCESESYTFSWWNHVFNKAADNLDVSNSKEGVLISKKRQQVTEISNKRPTKIAKKSSYGNFVKPNLSSNGQSQVENQIEEKVYLSKETDDELFAKCEGRTAHRAARHGLKMNGKLARVEEQERIMLKTFPKTMNGNSPKRKKRKKKA